MVLDQEETWSSFFFAYMNETEEAPQQAAQA